MAESYRPYHPDQQFLLPPSLREWLPEKHLVYFVSDVIDNLNLSALDAVYGDEQRGQPDYELGRMTKVLVYGYCVGGCSARGALSGAWPKTWGFAYWRRATCRTSAPLRISASSIWLRWPGCLKRC